ncbi:hypothetical protein B0H14DRAFT_2599218 [Mycena olivaceomarginata]|nr:hypothetical protein B0H14DRAFT_2599218 [Mycena olivaceomarginata]
MATAAVWLFSRNRSRPGVSKAKDHPSSQQFRITCMREDTMANLRDPSASGRRLLGANIEVAVGLTRSRISVAVVDQQRARPSSTSSGDLLGPFPADLRLPSTSSLEALRSDPMMQHIHDGTFFTAANVNFFGTKKHHLEETTQPVGKGQRLKKRYGIKIFRSKNIKLIHEIRSGPGYFLHTGQNKGRAVIFKIFNPGPTVQQRRVNVIPILGTQTCHGPKGISPPASLIHFVPYEDARWKNAEVPLAEALETDLPRSKALGYKMVRIYKQHSSAL